MPNWHLCHSVQKLNVKYSLAGVYFLSLVQNRFSSNELYILDAPEAVRLMTLLSEMEYLVSHYTQFIIFTHSPILMDYPGAAIFEISQKGIQTVDYQNTEHYWITKFFLDYPDKMFKYLFNK